MRAAMADCLRQVAKQAAKSWTDSSPCPHHLARRMLSSQAKPLAALAAQPLTTPETAASTTSQSWTSSRSWSQMQGLRRNTTQAAAGPENCKKEITPAAQGVSAALPALVVFGGNGFVGSAVCEEAIKTGVAVVSINRSGPPNKDAPWVRDVQWVQADVFSPAQWRSRLEGAIGVVSCIGAFGSNDFMLKINGQSNSLVFEEAAAAGVARAVYISVHDYNAPGFLLPGYFQGKRNAEQTLFAKFPQTGVALRPSFIHGSRQVGGISIPLSAVGVPLDKVLGVLPAKSLSTWPLLGLGLTPPVALQAVAKAAVAAATDPQVPAGVLDMWKIKETYEG